MVESKFKLLLIGVLIFQGAHSQSGVGLDSIQSVAEKAENSQEKISIYSKGVNWAKENNKRAELGVLYYNLGINYARNSLKDSALFYYKKGLPLLTETGSYLVAGKLCNNLALLKRTGSDSKLHYAQLSLKYRGLSEDTLEIGHAHLLLADIYDSKGIYSLSMKHHFAAMRIYEKENFTPGLINVYNNIAVLFGSMDEQEKKLHYQLKAVELLKQQKDSLKLASGYNNLANSYSNLGLYDSALYVHEKALKIRKEKSHAYGIAETNYNIADVYHEQGKCDKAMPFIQTAVKTFEKVNPTIAFLYGYNLYGRILDCTGDYSKSEPLLHKAYETSVKVKSLPDQNKILKSLSEHYSKKGEFSKAYKYRLKYEATEDSLFDKEKLRVIKELETEFGVEKRELQIRTLKQEKKIQEKELAVTRAKEKEQRVISYAVTGGLALVVLFAFFVFNRLQLTRKQKRLIVKQKQVVDEKNKEISDSINYAKRIQEAILPSKKALNEALKDGFVLFKPKDVVSGDFYWMEKVGDTTYFAAADCTGHGVPGAMVSVVCSHALTKSLIEEKISFPSKILDRTRELVIGRLAKGGEEVKDGMDISLCALNFKTGTLQWAGANNPLWIIRKGELIEYKHDKQAIGIQDNAKPFTNHTIELQKNDRLYVNTDGYQDQFGGPKGKKLKPSRLKKKLLAMQEQSMEQQKISLDQEFEDWRGENEQIDDVCVIGVRFV